MPAAGRVQSGIPPPPQEAVARRGPTILPLEKLQHVRWSDRIYFPCNLKPLVRLKPNVLREGPTKDLPAASPTWRTFAPVRRGEQVGVSGQKRAAKGTQSRIRKTV
jgi:hypothetical protein